MLILTPVVTICQQRKMSQNYRPYSLCSTFIQGNYRQLLETNLGWHRLLFDCHLTDEHAIQRLVVTGSRTQHTYAKWTAGRLVTVTSNASVTGHSSWALKCLTHLNFALFRETWEGMMFPYRVKSSQLLKRKRWYLLLRFFLQQRAA